MQALSTGQIQNIVEEIRDRHLALVVEMAGPQSVPVADLERLKKKGLITKGVNLIEQSYEFGLIASNLEDPSATSMPYAQFTQQIANGGLDPLTYEEKAAVKHLQRQTFERVKGLGNKYEAKIGQILIEADQKLRRKLAGRIKKETVQGVEHRRAVQQIAASLANATKDMTRDWERVASTEVHNAFLEGRADHIIAQNKGRDPLVFKRPRPDCCPRCAALYLEDKYTPKVFHLSELIANGTTNEGRKVGQWLPTLGCVHPYCQCVLHELPDGFGFDKHGSMVYQGIT